MDEIEFIKSLDGNVFTFADDWNLILDASGKIGSATGKTVVFNGSGKLQMLDNRNMIDNLTVDGDVDLNALSTPLTGVVADAIDFDTVGAYTLDGCTIGEVTNSSGGSITINLSNGATVTTNTGPNIELLVTMTISHNADGGSFGYLNLDKWTTLVGVYPDQLTGEAANPSPSSGDYFFIDPLSNGNRTDAVYWDGSAWVANGSATIMEGFVASTDLGGGGVSLLNTINTVAGTNIRLVYDKFGLYMSLLDVVASAATFSILLETNPNVDNSKKAAALPYTLQFALEGPEANGLMTMKVPAFDNNAGDNSDPGLAAAATELARLSSGSLQGALTTNNADLAEITSVGILTLKNDTLQVVPLDSITVGQNTNVPLYIETVNYTIDPTPFTAANTKCCFEQVPPVVVEPSVLGTVDASVSSVQAAALAQFATVDTGETSAVTGSVADLSTATGFSTFDPSTDQVTVATNNDKTNYSLTTTDKDDIVDRNWDESYSQHTTAGTFGKLMDLLRKANRAIEGEVTGTPTTTSFTSNITGYVTGAFDSEVLVFVSGTINGEARPILDYDSTNGTFNFEEAWTQAPSSSDEFIILPYHVHAISEIQEGLDTLRNVKPSIPI